jgi:hypothetical protein
MPRKDTVLENVTFLTARRSYEFRVDDLRLSALCTKPVEERLQALFHFRSVVMGSPMVTFGDVPATYPPGFVFDLGYWMSPDDVLVPIRFIHFEQRRIVIDVAGKSEAIEPIYEILRTAISELEIPDGGRLIGEPEAVYDYTEITAQCNFPLSGVLAPAPLEAVQRAAGSISRRGEHVLVPHVVYQWLPVDRDYAGATLASSHHSFTFSMRAGTSPENRICFSGAPIESDAHAIYLQEVATALRSAG